MSGTAVEAGRFGSGRVVNRIEDAALVRGEGQFTDDRSRPGELHCVFVRSPHAHARIQGIDVDALRAMAGVAAVFTGADLVAAGVKPLPPVAGFKRPDGTPAVSAARRALAYEVVRFVGEPVLAVLAETYAQARAAADAAWVDYDEQPAVTSVIDALAADAPRVIDGAPDNIAAQQRHGDAQACAAAFAGAAHRIVLDIDNQRLAPTPIEPRAVQAEVDAGTGRLTMWLSSQMPTGIRNALSDLLPDLPKEMVRVRVGDVGGGFGMKTGAYPEDIAVAHAARETGRPVRWRAERLEEFTAAVHGRDVVSRAELALDAHGRVLALRVRSFANTGAYAGGTGVAIPLLIGPWVSTSVYDIPVIDFDLHAVMTHTTAMGAYRGAGRPEAIYLIERLMDAAARELKLDPAELRRRNFISPAQMPYRNPMAQTYDCGQFERVMDQGLALADYAGYEARRAQSLQRGRLRGRGLATFLEWTGGNVFEERVTVDVTPDGFIEVCSAVQGMGQGIATSLAQLAVDVFDVPLDRIRVVMGDTDRNNGFGSAGSRSIFTGGSAVKVAAQRTVDHARELASQALEAPVADVEYAAGRYTIAGTDRGIGLFELAGGQPEARIHVDATSAVGGPTWPNGCHVCEVEVDPDTGEVEVVAYASVNDIGRVISPAIARGQIDGGAVQGIGQALCEKVSFDPASGQNLTGTLMDYAMPRVDGFRAFKTAFDEATPCTVNPIGVKGVGELGTIGATPAVVNAVVDALATAGLGRAAEALQMPLTAEQVWRALARRELPASPFKVS